jgi:dsDNA-specific endonuclease/ATPase MutS2
MSGLAIGDYVGILEGTEKGFIIKIEKNKAWIETKDGFEITAPLNKLVKYEVKKKSVKLVASKSTTRKSTNIDNTQKEEFPLQKKPVIRKVKDHHFKINPALIGEDKKHTSKKQEENLWEIDLHIEELTDDYKHLTNGEIVDIQLRHARMSIEKARINKINKIVFIHGKGKGTLRQELLHLLMGYTFLEYYDASFKRYGGGATEVRIFTSKV